MLGNLDMQRTNETSLLLGAGMGLVATSAAFFLYYKLSEEDGYKKQRVKQTDIAPRGLTNMGNTCFANSLLQGLASCGSMRAWLCRCSSCDVQPVDGQTTFIDAFKSILDDLNDAGNETLCAGRVVQALQQHGWVVPVGMQQDLYELFNIFVTTWEEELDVSSRQSMSLAYVNHLTSCKSMLQARLLVITREILHRSAVRPPCSATVASQLQCHKCKHKRVKQETFSGALSLSLTRSNNYGGVSLTSCLKSYFSPEVIHGVACDRCTVHEPESRSNATKSMGISRFPECLILRINRECYMPNGMVEKQQDNVAFPVLLDMNPFAFYRDSVTKRPVGDYPRTGLLGGCKLANQQSLQMLVGPTYATSVFKKRSTYSRHLYELKAVSEHIGSADYGHYVTYRRGFNAKQWFRISDDDVTPVTFDTVRSSQAYMLFYEKIHER